MMLAWALAYAGIILLIGAAVVSTLLQRQQRSIPELLGLALTLGSGTCGVLLLWSSMIGIRTSRGLLITLGIVAIITLTTLAIMRRLPLPSLPVWDRRPASLLVILPVIALLLANLWGLIPALGFPIFEWDAFSIWGLKAKVLYESALTPRPAYFADVRFSFSHLDYPLLVPMIITGGYAMMGQIEDSIGKIALPLLLAGQTLLAYSAARLWLGRLGSLMIALVFICMPLNLAYAGIGNADVPLATFWLGSLCYLIRWMHHRSPSDLIITGLFVLFTAMTKSEGLPLAIIALLVVWVLSIKTRKWNEAVSFTVILTIGIAIWLIWRAGIPRSDENYLGRLRGAIILENIHRLGVIVPDMARMFVRIERWGGFWLLLPLLATLGYRAFRDQRTIVLWAILVAHLMLYALAYVIAPWEDLNALIKASLERLLLHVAPAAMMLLAAHWSALLTSGIDSAQECNRPQVAASGIQ